MFLTTPKYPILPKWTLAMGNFTTIPQPPECWGWKKPEDLVTLGETSWPKEVKAIISEMFIQAGIEAPLHQKLVEPSVLAFKGRTHEDGTFDFENVNWQKVVEYFRWEIASSKRDNDLAQTLQDECRAKYGHSWSHCQPYCAHGFY